MKSCGWGLQELPRGAIDAAPRACVANPPSRLRPAPFSTQRLPEGSAHPARWLRTRPPTRWSWRLLLPASRLPPVSFTFDFCLESPGDKDARGWMPARKSSPRARGGGAVAERRPEEVVARSAAAWRSRAQAECQAQRCVRQALPAVCLAGWRGCLLVTRSAQVWRTLQPRLPQTRPRFLDAGAEPERTAVLESLGGISGA